MRIQELQHLGSPVPTELPEVQHRYKISSSEDPVINFVGDGRGRFASFPTPSISQLRPLHETFGRGTCSSSICREGDGRGRTNIALHGSLGNRRY